MSSKEIYNDFKENYEKVRKLLDEDSKNDSPSEPYLSKYKARDILQNMCSSLKTHAGDKTLKLDAMLGTVLLNIGIIDMETDDLSNSNEVLNEAEQLLSPNASKPEIITVIVDVYNNLGILWANRDQPEKAKTYLMKSKELYESFKCTLQMPLPIEYLIGSIETNDFMSLEKSHTLTLYYLAQVYGSLKEDLKSAIYCHITLKRQLQYSDYEPIDWALNSATLSQYFAEQNGFQQARHHLSAASIILDQYRETLQEEEQHEDEVHLAKMETLKHRSADVARCWVKYCLFLMSASKARLMSDSETLSEAISDMSNLTIEDGELHSDDIKTLMFPHIDVSEYENQITDKYLLTYADAREVFQSCQSWLSKAKAYYRPDTLASDYIQLVQDRSEVYKSLAFFEEDDERRAKMYKRRIVMLEELLRDVNPTYYLQYCRQIWYELGEIYLDVLNIKLDRMNKIKVQPTPRSLKKINYLSEKSIENYDAFLNSCKDKNGELPAKLDEDMIRPIISAYAYIGRNSMKRIAINKSVQLVHVRKSFDSYQAVVDICMNDPRAAALMPEEFSVCKEMVLILPLKIKKLESDMKA